MKTATYTMKDAAVFGGLILDRLRANPELKEALVGTHDRGKARPSLEVVQLPGGTFGVYAPQLIGLISERSIETPTGDWHAFADALDFLSWGNGFRQTWPEEPRLHRPGSNPLEHDDQFAQRGRLHVGGVVDKASSIASQGDDRRPFGELESAQKVEHPLIGLGDQDAGLDQLVQRLAENRPNS